MTFIQQYRAATLSDEFFPCVHGHIACSPTFGGRCSDEFFANHPSLNDEVYNISESNQ